MNAYKAYKARTAAGSSWQFIALISMGYVAGIAAKFVSGNINWVLAVYIFNLIAIGVCFIVYLRNRKLDAQRDVLEFELSNAGDDARAQGAAAILDAKTEG